MQLRFESWTDQGLDLTECQDLIKILLQNLVELQSFWVNKWSAGRTIQVGSLFLMVICSLLTYKQFNVIS